MLTKYSFTAVVLSLALSSMMAGVGSAQMSVGIGVGSGSALLPRDLRGGMDFQSSPVLNKHVQAALTHAKNIGREVGFGFYTNSNLGLEYVPGEIRNDGDKFYTHRQDWQGEDVGLLVAKFGGPRGDWEWVGDAHVHEGQEVDGSRVQQHKGVPSLNDLKGELKPRVSPPHIMMVIASRKWVKGFDASIVYRNGALAARSGKYNQVMKNAKDENEPQSHPQAIRVLGEAYSGGNITYFSGSFKGKRSQLKSGLFKNKGNP